jgi:hypothetical protein
MLVELSTNIDVADTLTSVDREEVGDMDGCCEDYSTGCCEAGCC